MDKSNKFLDNLTSYGVGYLVDEMAELQQKIVEAVSECGKSGSLTLKLSYKMNGEKQVIVNANVSTAGPRCVRLARSGPGRSGGRIDLGRIEQLGFAHGISSDFSTPMCG